MGSTANIAKITKAMQMVAASKLKGAESKLKASRPLMQMVNDMTAHIEAPVSAKTTFVPITTDRGLCGGVNINLTKELAKNLIPNEKAAGASVEVVSVGDKGRSQVTKEDAQEGCRPLPLRCRDPSYEGRRYGRIRGHTKRRMYRNYQNASKKAFTKYQDRYKLDDKHK